MYVAKVDIAESGSGDKLPLLKKCSHGLRLTQPLSTKVQLLAFPSGLVSKSGGLCFH